MNREAPRESSLLHGPVRLLRSTAVAFLLVSCIGLLIAWFLTYNKAFELFNNVGEWELYCVESWKGKVELRHNFNSRKVQQLGQWVCWTISDERMYADYPVHVKEWESTTLGVSWTKDDQSVSAPHWFLILCFGLLAALLKPPPRLKYGFHELLILTTVSALFVGCIALIARNLG